MSQTFEEWWEMTVGAIGYHDPKIAAKKSWNARQPEIDALTEQVAALTIRAEKAEAACAGMQTAWKVMTQLMTPRKTHPGYPREFYEIEKFNVEQCGKTILDDPNPGAALLAKLAVLTNERDEARAACAEMLAEKIGVEWQGKEQICPFCDCTKLEGHADDCDVLKLKTSNPGTALLAELAALREYKERLPANWFEDSSLETWFPLTAEELKRVKVEQAALKAKVEAAEKLVKASDSIALNLKRFSIESLGAKEFQEYLAAYHALEVK